MSELSFLLYTCEYLGRIVTTFRYICIFIYFRMFSIIQATFELVFDFKCMVFFGYISIQLLMLVRVLICNHTFFRMVTIFCEHTNFFRISCGFQCKPKKKKRETKKQIHQPGSWTVQSFWIWITFFMIRKFMAFEIRRSTCHGKKVILMYECYFNRFIIRHIPLRRWRCKKARFDSWQVEKLWALENCQRYTGDSDMA